MTLSDVSIVFGISTALLSVGATGGKYYLDNEYVTVSSIEQLFIERDVRDLKREIRILEFLKKKGTITDAQEWELDSLKDELEFLENQQ